MEKIFRTHDGVELSQFTKVWYCYKTGKDEDDNTKDIPTYSDLEDVTKSDFDDFCFFSTKEACQAYINRMNSPVIFTTHDGVDIKVDDDYYCVANGRIYGPYVCDEHCSANQGGPYFLTKEKAQEYIDSLKPVVELAKTVDQIGIDHAGKPIYEGYEIYCCYKDCPINTSHNIITVYICKYSTLNSDFVYFVHREECEQYIQAAKALKNTPVESPKSELEIAYDKLTALCAKYRQDNAVSQINTISHYPNGVTKYSILLFNDYGELLYETPKMHFLDEAVIVTNAWLIQNRHFLD